MAQRLSEQNSHAHLQTQESRPKAAFLANRLNDYLAALAGAEAAAAGAEAAAAAAGAEASAAGAEAAGAGAATAGTGAGAGTSFLPQAARAAAAITVANKSDLFIFRFPIFFGGVNNFRKLSGVVRPKTGRQGDSSTYRPVSIICWKNFMPEKPLGGNPSPHLRGATNPA